MDMTSFAPEELFLGAKLVSIERYIHELEFFRLTRLELRSLERKKFYSHQLVFRHKIMASGTKWRRLASNQIKRNGLGVGPGLVV